MPISAIIAGVISVLAVVAVLTYAKMEVRRYRRNLKLESIEEAALALRWEAAIKHHEEAANSKDEEAAKSKDDDVSDS